MKRSTKLPYSTFSISRYEVTHREFIEFMNGAGVKY